MRVTVQGAVGLDGSGVIVNGQNDWPAGGSAAICKAPNAAGEVGNPVLLIIGRDRVGTG